MLTSIGATVTSDTGNGNLDTLIPSQPWDVIFLQINGNFLSAAEVTAIGNYVAGGGKVIMNYWNMNGNPGLQGIMEISNTISFTSPLPVSVWDGAHPIFNTPNAVGAIAVIGDNAGTDNGDRLEPSGAAMALAGFTGAPTTNEAAIVLGNGDMTFYHGFAPADMDLATMLNLIENEMEFFFATPGCPPFDIAGPFCAPCDDPQGGSALACPTAPTQIIQGIDVSTVPGNVNVLAMDFNQESFGTESTITVNLYCAPAAGPVPFSPADTPFYTESFPISSADDGLCVNLPFTTPPTIDASCDTMWIEIVSPNGRAVSTPAACNGNTATGTDSWIVAPACGIAAPATFASVGFVLDASYNASFECNLGDPPVITCPANIMADNAAGQCSAVVNFAGTAVDTEDGDISASITYSPDTGSSFPVGTTTVTASVTDSDGNTVSCTFDVTVNDTEDPVPTCMDITVELDANGDVTVVPGDVATATDNCAVNSISFGVVASITPGEVPFNYGPSGLIDTPTTFVAPPNASADVTVDVAWDGDFSFPSTEVFELEGPDGSVVFSSAPGGSDCTTFYNDSFVVTAATWNDWIVNFGPDLTFVLQEDGDVDSFCTDASYQLTANLISVVPSLDFGCADVGDNDVIVIATDDAGNAGQCTAVVTVEDNIAPVIACVGAPNPVTDSVSTSPGLPINNATPVVVSTIDVTDDFVITDLDVMLDIPHAWVGDLIVDIQSPAGTTVTIIDQPGVPASTFGCDGDDILATLDDEATDPVEDECDAGVPTINGTFIPNNPLSAFDGESTLGTWTLTVTDTFAAADDGVLDEWGISYTHDVVAAPFDAVLDGTTGEVTVVLSDLLLSVDEACGFVVTDGGGGAPIPGDITTLFGSDNGGALGGAVYFDVTIGGTDLTLQEIDINTEDPGAFTMEIYTLVGTYVGNEGDPGAWTLSATATGTASGTIDVPSNSVLDTPLVLSGGTTYGMALVLSASHGHNYTNGDGTNQNYSNGDIEISLGAASNVPFDGSPFSPRVFNGTLYYEVGEPAATEVTFDCSNLGLNEVEITVTDDSGNSSTCTATVNVIDNTDPILVCMDATVELDENGMAEVTPDLFIDTVNSFDVCGITITAVDVTDVTCDDIGTPITVTVFASDASGNLASCTATLTVEDNMGPMLEGCPEDQTIDPGPLNLFYEVPDYWAAGTITFTDNCSEAGDIVNFSQDPVAGTLLPDGVYTVTLCAEDEYGNEGCCTFELTIESILGQDDIALDNAIVMYPNPTDGQVTISNTSNIVLERAAIYDANGRLVQEIDLSGMATERSFNVSSLASGVYMVQIQSENAQTVKRLVRK